jgi:hypothetical protein
MSWLFGTGFPRWIPQQYGVPVLGPFLSFHQSLLLLLYFSTWKDPNRNAALWKNRRVQANKESRNRNTPTPNTVTSLPQGSALQVSPCDAAPTPLRFHAQPFSLCRPVHILFMYGIKSHPLSIRSFYNASCLHFLQELEHHGRAIAWWIWQPCILRICHRELESYDDPEQ